MALLRFDRWVPIRSWAAWPRWFARFLGLGISFIGLVGCASAPPAVTYDLNPIEPHLASALAARAPRGELAVAMPSAISLIDSPRIVVRTGSDLAYLKGAEWAGRLPGLLQRRLVESFEKTHRLTAVGPVGDPALSARYTLETDIRRFEADVTRSTAKAVIYVRLLDSGGQIIAAQEFSGEAPSPHDDGATVSAALDGALGKVLHQIVVWTVPKV
jgi:cholesterol transport system auxiliary component